MTAKTGPIRETDEAARQQARLLLRGSRYGSIAALDPETGYPNCSRVLLGTTHGGVPVVLVSRLSAHTKALLADPRASLLVGEPGKGDPLAWPRMTVQCDAEPVERTSRQDGEIRTRFIRRHKKAALYAGFGDFLFILLKPVRASLNAGFGKAYNLDRSDFLLEDKISAAIAKHEEEILSRANQEWPKHSQETKELRSLSRHTIYAIDAEGIDLRKGNAVTRVAFHRHLDLEALENTLNNGIFSTARPFYILQG